MNHQETVQACRVIASLCPAQKFDKFTADSWALVLDDIDYADAQAAIRVIYREMGNDQEWGARRIEADDIIRQVRRSRSKSIASRAADYTPPAGLSPDEYMAWYRALLKRLGDGERPPVPAIAGQPRTIRALGRSMETA